MSGDSVIYEVINPSDAITFRARDVTVAKACVLLVGDGKYGLEQKVPRVEGDKGPAVPFMFLMAAKEFDDYLTETFGGDFGEYMKAHLEDMAEALESFLCMTASQRVNYERAMELMPPENRELYRDEVHDRERSSTNDIAGCAWGWAKRFRKLIAKQGAPAEASGALEAGNG